MLMQVHPVAADEENIVDTLRIAVIDEMLPLWAKRGWDSKRGGFVERLHPNGDPDANAVRRLRVQARQIYCFAKAFQLGWYPEGREIALKGLDFLLSKGRHGTHNGYVHMLNADGSVRNSLVDTYDQAFVLLAFASLHEITGDSAIRVEIDKLVDFFETRLRSPAGGFLEGAPHSLPRRQNPHMHAFEAMLALYAATKDIRFRQHAEALHNIFIDKLFDPNTSTLGEYFGENWTPYADNPVEPGHQAEWVWLLGGFERATGIPTSSSRTALLRSALRYAEASTGCLVDEGSAGGRITKATRRCWPQTELAKAWIAQAEFGETDAASQARAALKRLQRHYLTHPVPGAWYDQFDDKGQSLVDYVPASTFYHILCAVAESERVLR